MQQLINTVRATGATQPIILGGVPASDPCGFSSNNGIGATCSIVNNIPKDPLNQLVIDFHKYIDSKCSVSACWQASLNSIHAANLPLVTDELGEDDCSDNFMNTYINWADANNISYLAWAWLPPSTSATTCVPINNPPNNSLYWINYSLLNDYSGTPDSLIPQASNYQSHLSNPAVYGTE